VSTVVAVYDSDGCVGRCDAKCHDAKEPGCDCICGGRNHGVGRGQAIENTRVYVGEWLTAYAAEKGLDRSELEEMVGVDVVQEALPI
jgi:hypothetical protein